MNFLHPTAWRAFFLSAFFCTAGLAAAASFTFSNTNPITINAGVMPPTKATPYPSSITVTGFAGQVLTKATVALKGFNHSFPSDVDILLVAPDGQMAILMSNVGGQNKYSVTNLTLTLEDDATNSLPVYTALTSGTFKPTNGYLVLGHAGLPFDFPSPAPTGSSNAVAALSRFANSDPDGVWNVYVMDEGSGDAGIISGGWSLNISLGIPLQIALAQTNVILSWPGTATNCTLQARPNLGGSVPWSEVANPPILTANRYVVTNRIVAGGALYRLIQN